MSCPPKVDSDGVVVVGDMPRKADYCRPRNHLNAALKKRHSLCDEAYNIIWHMIQSKDFESLGEYLLAHPEEISLFRQRGPQKKTLLHRMCQPPLGYTDICSSLVAMILTQDPSLAAIPLNDEYPLHMAIRNLDLAASGNHILVPLIRAYPAAAGMMFSSDDGSSTFEYLYPLEAIFSSPTRRPPLSVVNELLAWPEGFSTIRMEGRMAPLDYFQQNLFPSADDPLSRFRALTPRLQRQYRQEVRNSAEWTLAKVLILSEYRKRHVNLKDRQDNTDMIRACFSVLFSKSNHQDDRRSSYSFLEYALILDENNELSNIRARSASGGEPECGVEDERSLPIHLACQVGHYDSIFYIMETHPETVGIQDFRGKLPMDHFLMYLSGHRYDPDVRWQSRKQRRTILKMLQVSPSSAASVLKQLARLQIAC